MKKKSLFGFAFSLALAASACGGSDDASTALIDQFVDRVVDEAALEGFGLDRECAGAVASELSETDVQALLDDDWESLSPDGNMRLFELVECYELDGADL